MFDKMIFNLNINFDKEALPIAERNSLQACMEGENAFYQSTQKSRFEGVFIKVKDNRVQIKCSLHKLYYKTVYGILDNSSLFAMNNARQSLDILFDMVGVNKDRAKVTYYEIGLSLPTEHDPIKYIELIKSITTGRSLDINKEMFNDAHFNKHRQKTTEKIKTLKKIFKVYDKGWENADRKRTDHTGEKILRIETIYRRQSIPITKFFSEDNINKLARTFYRDWANLDFTRNLTADKGARASEKVKAEKIILLGREGYLEQSKTDFDNGNITAKNFRGIREFIRDWDNNKHKYRMLPTIYEKDYKEKLLYWFKLSSS